RAHASRLRTTLGADVILLGVDRLDYTKGIPDRLLAFERFLERHPEWRRRVSLVQITVPSQFHVPEFREMKRTIDEIVGRVTGRRAMGVHAGDRRRGRGPRGAVGRARRLLRVLRLRHRALPLTMDDWRAALGSKLVFAEEAVARVCSGDFVRFPLGRVPRTL